MSTTATPIDIGRPGLVGFRLAPTGSAGLDWQRLDETWALAAFEVRSTEFTVPSGAFSSSSSSPKPQVFLNAYVGDLDLNRCVEQGGTP